MILLKTIRNRHYMKLLQLQNHLLTSFNSPKSSEIFFISSVSVRPFSLSAQFSHEPVKKSQKPTEPLSDFFKGAISGSQRTNIGGVEPKNTEIAKSPEIFGNLEEGVRSLSKEKGDNGKSPSLISVESDLNEQNGSKVNLSAFFTTKKKGNVKFIKPTGFGYEDPMVFKELSSDMQMFAYHLYMEGYFKDAKFILKNVFDETCFERKCGRDFLKFAAAKFGEDHQEIAKWLSASDLKKVALFGCPSRGPKTAYAAKHMRSFFQIEEQKVCQNCTLRKSCMVVNKRVMKYSQLDLAKVIKVLIMYSMEPVPEQLVVPEEINASVGRLLKEIINLVKYQY